MGGRAVSVTVGFSAPPNLPATWVAAFGDGLRVECAEAGVLLVGGDVTAARDITVSVSVLGVLDGRPAVLRSGASAGHVVALTGRTGWAAAGLVVLGRGFQLSRAVVDAYRVPGAGPAYGPEGADRGRSRGDRDDRRLRWLDRPTSGTWPEASKVIIDLDGGRVRRCRALQAVSAATGTDPYRAHPDRRRGPRSRRGVFPLASRCTGGLDDHRLDPGPGRRRNRASGSRRRAAHGKGVRASTTSAAGADPRLAHR